ncbi:MAG: hypothetical protein WD206_07980 [Actinomycetota bacterium]
MAASGNQRGAGWVLFAATVMILVGAFQAFMGLIAILDDPVFLATPNYTLELSTSSWGWLHLLWGTIVVLVGLGLLAGQTWARAVGIIVVGAQAFVNFMHIPVQPWWSILLIALDIAVIWALCVYRPAEID